MQEAYSQTTPTSVIMGSVHSDDRTPLAVATVQLYTLPDSGRVKIELSDELGTIRLSQLSAGRYYIQIAALGFNTWQSEAFDLSDNDTYDLGAVVLETSTIELEAVDVSAQRPLVEIQSDRTVVNVDRLLSAQGGTAWDVLRQSPGLSTNASGEVAIRGKSKVLILVDGRQTYLSGPELTDYLKGLAGSQLAQVEIITQPSAKYDAEGTGGVINLKTKKGITDGLNGSISLAGRQGRHTHTNNSLNINWKSGNINLFANYSYVLNNRYLASSQTSDFFNPSGAVTAHNQQAFTLQGAEHAHTLKTGVDYGNDKGLSLHASYSGNFARAPGTVINTNSNISDAGYLPTATNHAIRRAVSYAWRHAASASLEKQWDSTGQRLTIAGDFLSNNVGNNISLTNTYQPLTGGPDQLDRIRQQVPSNADIYGLKADYHYPATEAINVDWGIKASRVHMDNDAVFLLYNDMNNQYERDPTRSVHYIFNESIYAAYLTYRHSFTEAWQLQAGIRVEHTRNDGEEMVTNESFGKHYTDVFPSATLSYQLTEQHSLSATYSRRTNRPLYYQLVPYRWYSDLLYYVVGNPKLAPEITNNIDISHTYAGKLTTSLSFNRTQNLITDISRVPSANLAIEDAVINMGRAIDYNLSVMYTEQPAPWLSTSLSVTGQHIRFNYLNGSQWAHIHQTNWQGMFNSQFTWGKSWAAELSASYQDMIRYGPFIIMKPTGQLTASVRKTILDGKGSITLVGTDLLNTYWYKGITQTDELRLDFSDRIDSRLVGLSFSYRFGNSSQAQKAAPASSTEEEAARLQSQ